MDLTMIERGRAVYDIFLSKGVSVKSKNIAKEINNARIKRSKKIRLERNQSFLLKICKELSLDPSKIQHWLEFLSVPRRTGI